MDRRTPQSLSRRGLLSALSAATVAGTAGCLGGGGGGGSQTPENAVESLPRPVQGDPDADVTVAVFEDYACPHCQTFAVDVKPRLAADYIEPGDIRYEHYDFPIPVHDRWSWEAGGAARAVQDTVDVEAFFAFTKRLFEDGWSGGSMQYSESFLRESAEAVGADPDTVIESATSGRYRPVLQSDREEGDERGVRGTPSVFVNGTLLEAADYGTVSSAIESER